MKCFYHSDADGQMSAMWVYAHAGLHNDNDGYLQRAEFISINYKDDFPFELILEDEQIYIVDFSIQPEEMLKLLEITKDVTWIDHHKTSIEKYQDFPHEIRGVRYDGFTGCELTYAYIHHMTERGSGEIKPFNPSMLDDCPMHTRYIGDRDVWKFELGDNTRHFYAGYQTLDNSIDKLVDYFIFEDVPIDGVIHNGQVIEQFKSQQRKWVVETFAHEVEFEGYKMLACNSHDKTSELFGDRFNDYDVCSVYCHDGKQYTVSLYSLKVDVSEIAKKYGGGGHQGASGFVCDKVPYLEK